ncbi:MAG: ABC transporter ATP-binding protein [Planctomycetes bacterium]|nr:ABC transporter ATP-binding protein [Planctomycetota bacterium]
MIRVRRLTKAYADLTALRGLSLDVAAGDCYGLIGPNGAGKTTLLRILANLLLPTEGRAWIGDAEVTEKPDAARRLIGYMPDTLPTIEDMTVREVLEYFGRCHHLLGAELTRRVDAVIELVDLGGKRDAAANQLSRGMRQRLCLGQTLIHDPQVLLLDEPASGLDPKARIEFRNLMKELRAMGKTILISSHILTELSDFCNAMGIVERGRLVLGGKVEEILSRMKGTRTLRLDFLNEPAAFERVLARVLRRLAGGGAAAGEAAARAIPLELSHPPPLPTDSLLDRIVALAITDRAATLEFAGAREDVADLHAFLIAQGIRLVNFHEHQDNLEDIFLRVAAHQVS